MPIYSLLKDTIELSFLSPPRKGEPAQISVAYRKAKYYKFAKCKQNNYIT